VRYFGLARSSEVTGGVKSGCGDPLVR
jgi:hypothetical protein